MPSITCSCYCGAVRLDVSDEKVFGSGICGCDSCKRAHASLIYSVTYVATECVKILQGEERLKFVWKADQVAADAGQRGRAFCSGCGSSMLIRQPWGTGVFHGTFDDPRMVNLEPWNPFDSKAAYYHAEEQQCNFLVTAFAGLTKK